MPCVPCRMALKGRQVKPRERERERVTEVALCLCKDLWVNKSPLVCVTPPQRHYLLCHGDMSVSRVCR